jgi:hypothetical protein
MVQRAHVSGVNSSCECRGESRRRGNLGLREITSRVHEPGDRGQVVVCDPYIVVGLSHFFLYHNLLDTSSLQHY